jgi:ubiquinone/menaquinone biosynthesis C-methylase UbiE
MAEQMRCPNGPWGGLAARVMKKYNAEAELWTVEQLHLSPADCVLEIGFGPGIGLRQVLSKTATGSVYGIDLSPRMIRMASRINNEALQAGKLHLQAGSANHLPYRDQMFDKVFAVNVIYFWDDPKVELSEIMRTLKAEGQVALYVVEKNDMQKMEQARTDVFHLLENEEIVRLLLDVGFRTPNTELRKEQMRTGVCISGFKGK